MKITMEQYLENYLGKPAKLIDTKLRKQHVGKTFFSAYRAKSLSSHAKVITIETGSLLVPLDTCVELM